MTRTLADRVYEALEASYWPKAGEPLLVGVSGGSDSVALTFLLHQINQEQNRGWRLCLAHLNHRLRGCQSDEDEQFVRSLATRHGWDVEVGYASEASPSPTARGGLEEVARTDRYRFFASTLAKLQGQVVALAHHADDQIETVLHRFLRGTGLRGLCGMPQRRSLSRHTDRFVIRPLLGIRREEIARYTTQNRIEYRQDHTNLGTEQTRNRIRNELIMYLRKNYNPAIEDAVLRLARQAQWAQGYLAGIAHNKWGNVVVERSERSVVMSAKALMREPDYFHTELVRRAIAALGVGEKQMSFDHLMRIVELAKRSVSGKKLQLPRGLEVHKQRDRITIIRRP